MLSYKGDIVETLSNPQAHSLGWLLPLPNDFPSRIAPHLRFGKGAQGALQGQGYMTHYLPTWHMSDAPIPHSEYGMGL